jgi:formylglycine-generating enzyme required for sulfatase activity
MILDAPAYSLYDRDAIAVATFFGGPLAGAILMALNYRRLGSKSAAPIAIAIGVSATGLLLVIGFNLPAGGLTALSALPLVLPFAARAIAKACQGIAVAEHVSRGGPIASRWPAFGVGIAVLALLALGLYAFVDLPMTRDSFFEPPGETRTAAAPPGPSRMNAKDGLRYVWIAAGTFTMGCSPDDGECLASEKPAHPVTISKGLWMGQTEVTQAAYARVMNLPASRLGRAMPANVNWSQAQAYCQAAGMRLPTEAEWEYAARGGNPSARYGPLDSIAWHNGNSGRRTHNVAQKQPNGYGLYDMLGNVWEWVSDWYDLHYYESAPPRDPQGPASGDERGLRGGASFYSPWGARASHRFGQAPDAANEAVGVRCAGE